MPRLGQHFLKNKTVLKKIIDALELHDGDFVAEIGPGHGELTAAIIEKAGAENIAVKIVAVEKDEQLAQLLRDRFQKNQGEAAYRNRMRDTISVEIRTGDALAVIPELSPGKIVGNIPYYITGKLLRILSEIERKPVRSVIMLQREVAERLCAAPPHMNRLAASVQFWADAKTVASVPKEDFSPVPEVDSAVVLLVAKNPQPTIDPERYYEAVRAIFAQPRKTVLNNITAVSKKKFLKQEIEASLKKKGLIPTARPQNLAIQDIESITGTFF